MESTLTKLEDVVKETWLSMSGEWDIALLAKKKDQNDIEVILQYGEQLLKKEQIEALHGLVPRPKCTIISRDSGDSDDDDDGIVPEIRDVADEDLLQDNEACLEPELETTAELFKGILALKPIKTEKNKKKNKIRKDFTIEYEQNSDTQALRDKRGDDIPTTSPLPNILPPFDNDCPYPKITKPEDMENAGDLITTEELFNHGYCFLVRPFKIFVCWKCEEAVPLTSVNTHMTDAQPGRYRWRVPKEQKTNCLRPHQVFPKDTKLSKRLVADLVRLGIVKGEEDIMTSDAGGDSFRKAAVPPCFPEPSPPIPGLYVVQTAYSCPEDGCNHWVPKRDSLTGHMLKIHNKNRTANEMGRRRREDVHLQTLSPDTVRYFPVTPVKVDAALTSSGPTLPSDPNSAPTPSLTPAEMILRRKKAYLAAANPAQQRSQPTANYYKNLKEKRIQPHLVSSGIEPWLTSVGDRSKLYKAVSDPINLEKPTVEFTNLRRILVVLFAEDMELVSKTHHSVLFMVTNSYKAAPEGNGQNSRSARPLGVFNDPKTIAKYSLCEVKMIFALYTSCLQSSLSPDGSKSADVFRFEFTETQRKLLLGLQPILEQDTNLLDAEDRLEVAKGAVRRAVTELYFPSSISYARASVFKFAPIAWLVGNFVDSSGSYIDPHLMTPHLAKISYCFRIRGVREMWERSDRLVESTGHEPDFKEDCAKPFIRRELDAFGTYPYATLRYFMGGLSAIAMNIPRDPCAWWKGDALCIAGGTFSFPAYRSYISKKLLELEAFYETHVLMGLGSIDDFIRLMEVEDPSEDLANHETGFGVAYEGRDEVENRQAKLFMNMLFEGNCLGFSKDHPEPNPSLMGQWLKDVDSGLRLLYPLIHISQGPPGRGSEELTLQITNTEQATRNVIWDAILESGGFNSDYSKNASITKKFTHILRILPFRIWALLYLHMRVVRPVEETYILEKVKLEDRKTISDAYSTHVFVSGGRLWSSNDMSAALYKWFEEGFGTGLTLRSYRHFAIGGSRKYLNFSEGGMDQVCEDEAAVEARESQRKAERDRVLMLADRMAGHTPAVARGHYARQPDDGLSVTLDRDQQRIVLRAWHNHLGLKTAYQPLTASEQAAKSAFRADFEAKLKGGKIATKTRSKGPKKARSTGRQRTGHQRPKIVNTAASRRESACNDSDEYIASDDELNSASDHESRYATDDGLTDDSGASSTIPAIAQEAVSHYPEGSQIGGPSRQAKRSADPSPSHRPEKRARHSPASQAASPSLPTLGARHSTRERRPNQRYIQK